MRKTRQDILDIARRQGIITPAEVRALGLAPENLNLLAEQGKLNRVGRGLYEHPDFLPSQHHSYVEVAKAIPHGVVCLLSALSFHGVGTQMPWEVWIAVPRGHRVPQARRTRLRVVSMSGRYFDCGIEEHELEGVSTRIYSLEKTIIDCFRLRRLVGHDVPIEALRESLRDGRIDVDRLLTTAEQLRARRLIQPYLDALI